jgi:hypothetical protein
MTLPLPKKLADASLDAAIVVYVARHPGAMRGDIECSSAVAAILARTETATQSTEWLHERLKHLRGTGVIEQRRWRRGWFVVHAEAFAS